MKSKRYRQAALIASVCVAAALAGACGSSQPDYRNYYVNLRAVKVSWEGSVASDPKLKADFDATVDCVRAASMAGGGTDAVKTTAYPNVVVIDQPDFTCYGISGTRACTGFLADAIYIDKADLYTYVFTHEAIHWIAQVDNSQHFRSYFSCGYSVDTFYQ